MFPDKPDKDYIQLESDQNLKEVLVCSLIMVARYRYKIDFVKSINVKLLESEIGLYM